MAFPANDIANPHQGHNGCGRVNKQLRGKSKRRHSWGQRLATCYVIYMKHMITYFLKCEYCGKISEYIVRDKNVNKELTDSDIRKMISMYHESPTNISYCYGCELETLQTRVAWGGTLDT